MKEVFKDKVGNRIFLGEREIGVKNAEGKYLNPTATIKYLKEKGFKIFTKNKELMFITPERFKRKLK